MEKPNFNAQRNVVRAKLFAIILFNAALLITLAILASAYFLWISSTAFLVAAPFILIGLVVGIGLLKDEVGKLEDESIDAIDQAEQVWYDKHFPLEDTEDDE